jgi:hypothetical protein
MIEMVALMAKKAKRKSPQPEKKSAWGKIVGSILSLIGLTGLVIFLPRLSATQAAPDPASASHDELSSSQFVVNNDGQFRLTDVVSACYVGQVDETTANEPGPAVHLADWVSIIVRPANSRLLAGESFTVPCTSTRFFGMPVAVKNADLGIVVYYRPWPLTLLRLHRLFRFVARRGDQGQLIWDKQPSEPLETDFDKWLDQNGGEFPPPHQ